MMEGPGERVSTVDWQAMPDHVGDPEKDRHEQVASIAIRLCQELLTTIMRNSLRACGADTGCIYQVDYGARELLVLVPVGEGWEDLKEHPRIRLFAPGRHGITGYVASTGKAYVSGDVSQDPHYEPLFEEMRSELAVPVMDRSGKVIGVLNMESRKPNAFTRLHRSRLERLAGQAALVMSLADYEAREKSLLELGRGLSVLKETQALIHEVTDIAAVLLKAQDCSLFLLEDGDTLRLRASVGSLSQYIEQATYRIGEGLTGWVAANNRPLRTRDPRKDARWRGLYAEFPPEELEAFLAVPVPGREGVLGVMRVVRRRWPGNGFSNEFTENDEELMLTLASQLGVALDNAELVGRLMEAERMAASGQMAARAAHMIGNAVFAVKGHLNELNHRIEDGAGRAELTEVADRAQEGIYRLEEILQGFKDFVVASRLDTSSEGLDELMGRLLADIFPQGTQVRLKTEFGAKGAMVKVDVAKFRRCCEELVLDSVRALEGKGNITVRTGLASGEETRALGARPSLTTGFARIDFVDDGPGVKAENKDKIFTPFFTTRAKGMGLGLSIVKGTVEAHGGSIREVGEEGKGAHFVIMLPLLEVQGSRDD